MHMYADVDDDITDVLKYLNRVVGQWDIICRNLHVTDAKITELRASGRSANYCLDQAIADWLKLNYKYRRHGKPTWRLVAGSVYKVDYSLFRLIAKEHVAKPVNSMQNLV